MSIRKFLLFFVALTLIFVPKTFAVEIPTVKPEFSTSFDVLYDIDEQGVANVTQKGFLKNLTAQYYANQYKLDIPSTQIFDTKASDGGGEAQVSISPKGTINEVTIKFNQQITGLNKVAAWTLQYKSKDFAQNLGKSLEIRIPKIQISPNVGDYNLTISVPEEFGEPSFVKPIPKKKISSLGKILLSFDKSQLLESGVSINFDSTQVYDFNLTYHLVNDTFFPQQKSIVLPPDTGFQSVIFNQIEPKPINVTVDDEGNYLAWYKLSKKSKFDVIATGSAKLYLEGKVKKPALEARLKKKYVQLDKFWDTNNLQTISRVTEILNQKDVTQKARLIYQYVVNNDSGNFAGSFIALARAAGVPARELDGYVNNLNSVLRPLELRKDSMHIWAEYWDDAKGWVMVDPAWEKATGGVDYFDSFDLTHFVAKVIGSGKNQYMSTVDVKIISGEKDFLGEPKLNVQIENSNPILAGFPEKIKVKVSNFGNGIYYSSDFAVGANTLTILNGDRQKLGPIPAFGSASFDFNVRTKGLFDSYLDQITVTIGSHIFTKHIQISPLIIFQTYPAVGIGIISLMGVLYFVVLGKHIHKTRVKKKTKKSQK